MYDSVEDELKVSLTEDTIDSDGRLFRRDGGEERFDLFNEDDNM